MSEKAAEPKPPKEHAWLPLAKAVGAAVVVIFLAGVASWDRIGAMAEARAEAKVAQLEPRVSTLEQGQQLTRADVHELGLDVRELYRVSPMVRSSPRLEGPPVSHQLDGGSP